MASDGPGPRNWGSAAFSVMGTYQMLDPLPLSLWCELRAQGPYLISPHQDGPDGIEEERERSSPASNLTDGLLPDGPSNHQGLILPMPIPFLFKALYECLQPAR